MKKLIFITLIIIGCESINQTAVEDVSVTTRNIDEQREILEFNSFDELELLLENNMRGQENLTLHYNQESFESYYSKAEKEYLKLLKKVQKNEIKGRDKIYKAVEELKDYVEIVIDENGDENVQPRDLNGYGNIINKDKMVKVGGKLIKVFENGFAETEISNYKALKTLTCLEETPEISMIPTALISSEEKVVIDQINSKEIVNQSYTDCLPDNTIVRWTINGSNRIKLKFDVNRQGWPDKHVTKGRFKVRGQERFSGIWWNVSKTIAGFIALEYVISQDFAHYEYPVVREEYPPTNQLVISDQVFNVTRPAGAPTLLENTYFMWGDAVDTEPVVTSCNINDICNEVFCLPAPFTPDPCEGVVCPPGSSCDNGNCIPDTPPSGCDVVPCGPGYRCVNSVCQAI